MDHTDDDDEDTLPAPAHLRHAHLGPEPVDDTVDDDTVLTPVRLSPVLVPGAVLFDEHDVSVPEYEVVFDEHDVVFNEHDVTLAEYDVVFDD